MQKKFLVASALVIGLMFFASSNLSACGFTFDIVENKKEQYSSGDKFVVSIVITNTCRSCSTNIDNTIFDFSGLKSLNATPWKQLTNGVFERRFTLEVEKKGKSKYSFDAVRMCPKGDKRGAIQLMVK
jgi:hypothetical protein